MAEDVFLRNLNEEQRRAVTHEGSPLLILAGAGSGKTRVITTKIAWLIAEKGVSPERILAVTFTNKAAREMSARAAALEPMASAAEIRTFHSFGARFLRRYALAAGVSPHFNIYDDDDAAALLRRAEPGLSAQQVPSVMRKIDRMKNLGLAYDDPDVALVEPDPDFAEIYRSYTRSLRNSGNVDFGDLICLPMQVLRTNPDIRAETHARFSVVLVDEYQDSNAAQFEFLKELVGPDTYLCVVGDDDQSIYSFRGAEVSNILSFAESFPGTEIVRLERNYRSTPEILRVASGIVSHNAGRLGKTLRAEHCSGKKPALVFLTDQEKEAEFCAQLIQQAFAKGCPYRDWAVLYRTNAQSLAFETEFLRAKIPYAVVGALKFYEREEVKNALALLSFVANRRDGVSFFRVLRKTVAGVGEVTCRKINDEFERLVSLYPSPGLYGGRSESIGGKTDEAKNGANGSDAGTSVPSAEEEPDYLRAAENILSGLKKAGAALSDFIAALKEAVAFLEGGGEADDADAGKKLSAFVFFVLGKSGLYDFYKRQDDGGGSSRVLNLDELGNAAVFFPCTAQGLMDFLERIQLDREAVGRDEESASDRVTLITLHNTKGLEFERVVITGLESGLFPREDKTGEALEEERRLMYVGCTRAMKRLYVTSCAFRRMYGSLYPMKPSVFLFEMPADGVRVLGTPPSSFVEFLGSAWNEEASPSDSGTERRDIATSADASGGDGDAGAWKKSVRRELAGRWKKGVTVFHDDYGYGIITAAFFSGGDPSGGGSSRFSEDSEYVISVRFESGGEKKFMPEYQAHTLMIVKE